MGFWGTVQHSEQAMALCSFGLLMEKLPVTVCCFGSESVGNESTYLTLSRDPLSLCHSHPSAVSSFASTVCDGMTCFTISTRHFRLRNAWGYSLPFSLQCTKVRWYSIAWPETRAHASACWCAGSRWCNVRGTSYIHTVYADFGP